MGTLATLLDGLVNKGTLTSVQAEAVKAAILAECEMDSGWQALLYTGEYPQGQNPDELEDYPYIPSGAV
jgi:hypothetical protein